MGNASLCGEQYYVLPLGINYVASIRLLYSTLHTQSSVHKLSQGFFIKIKQ